MTGSDRQERFLVHHILGIELNPGMHVGLAVAGEGTGGSTGGEALHAGRRLPDADARRSNLDSSTAPGQGKASARLPALRSQFSGVNPVRVARALASGLAAAAPGAAVHSPPTPSGNFSTDPGHQPGSRRVQRGTASVATPTRAAPVPAYFTETREVVRLLARKGYRTTERGPQTFPGTAEPVLVIEVEKGGQHRYLVERERRGDRSSGPLIVATLPQRRRASDAELARLLTLRNAKRVWLTYDPALAWLLARVNHAYTSHESFRDAILKRVNA